MRAPGKKILIKKCTTAIAVCALLGAASAGLGQSPIVSYSQGPGTGTAIPGGTGNFTGFSGAPSVSAGGPAFTGSEAARIPDARHGI